MSAFDLAALAGAQEARDMAESVMGGVEAASGMAKKAEGTAQAAATAAEQAGRLAREAAAGAPRLFTSMAAAGLPTSVTVIGSNGFAEVGMGMASYVSDAKATAELAKSHPSACFKGDGGRYFRLKPSETGAISPEQLGCPATGGNAQPAIQAALDYAAAVGITRIELPADRYDLWCPIRNHGEHVTTGPSGHYMTVRENIAIIGTGRGRTLLRLLNSQGGTNDIVTQPNMTYSNYHDDDTSLYARQQRNWMGTGINVRPNTGLEYFKLQNVDIDGTKTYHPNLPQAEHDATINLTHKCFRVQDVDCHRVELLNGSFRNFGGEIMYTAGGTGVREEHFENFVFEGSPQCAINSGTGARSSYINVEAGRSYQNEILGGKGKSFVNCRFYDMTSIYLAGGAGAGENAFDGPYSRPLRRAGYAPPYMTFQGVTMERCGIVILTSFAKGDLYLVDTSLALDHSAGGVTDVDLTVTSILDAGSGATEAVSVSGPPTASTPIPGSSVNYTITSNVKVDLTVGRTEAAKAAGRFYSQAVRVYGQLMDPESVMFTIHGTAVYRACDLLGAPVPNFTWPRIIIAPDFVPVRDSIGAGTFHYLSDGPNTATKVTLWPGVNAVEPQHNGPFRVSIDNGATGFADGQVATIVHNSNDGRPVRFPAGIGGMRLQQDRYLINRGDRIDLRWSAKAAAWIETGYTTSAVLTMNGQATYDPPQIAPGGTASTKVVVPGAVVGDLVTAISFGNTDLHGLTARAEVTGENNVTVWLTNSTSGSPDLPALTLRVQVTKGFAA